MKQVFWVLVLLAIAAVTAAMQFDRQSRYSPEWAVLTPEPARYFVQTHIAVRALESDNEQDAREAAITLLKRRPVPAENVRLYAQAQIKDGEVNEAVKTFQIAARRGWRDPVVQEAMAQIAWMAGDHAASANRLAALYARETLGDFSAPIVEDVLSDPAGREQMAVLLAGPTRWEPRFVRNARHDMSHDTFNAIMLEAHAKGAQLTCGPLRQAAARQARDRGVTPAQTPLGPLLERNCE